MLHTILYFGHFDRNFRALNSDTSTYRDRDGAAKAAEEPSPKVDGCRFRYMECRGREFVAVGVDDLVLRAPVLLIPERHTDGKGFLSVIPMLEGVPITKIAGRDASRDRGAKAGRALVGARVKRGCRRRGRCRRRAAS